MTTQVRVTVVADEGKAEIVCGLLRSEQIAYYHRVTDVSSWANRGPPQFWGWREVLVNEEDLPRARELLTDAGLEPSTTE